MSSTKEKAIVEVLKAIAEHSLSIYDLYPDLSPYCQEQKQSESVLGFRSFFGIFGGLLILAGVITVIGINSSKTEQAYISIIAGWLLYISGFIVNNSGVVSTVAFALGAILETAGLLYIMVKPNGENFSVVYSIMLGQYAVAYVMLLRSEILFFAFAYGVALIVVILSKMRMKAPEMAMSLGSVLLMTVFRFDSLKYANVLPLYYFIGSAALIGGAATFFLDNKLGNEVTNDMPFAVIVVGLILFGGYVHSPVISFNSSMSLVGYVWYKVFKHLKTNLGGASVMFLVGVSILFIGWLSF
jgi:hypothetical protein